MSLHEKPFAYKYSCSALFRSLILVIEAYLVGRACHSLKILPSGMVWCGGRPRGKERMERTVMMLHEEALEALMK